MDEIKNNRAIVHCRHAFITSKFFRQSNEIKRSIITQFMYELQATYTTHADTPICVLFDGMEVPEDHTGAVVYVPYLTLYRTLTVFAELYNMPEKWVHLIFSCASPSMYCNAVNNAWIPAPLESITEESAVRRAVRRYTEHTMFLCSTPESLAKIKACVSGNIALSTAYNEGVRLFNENNNASIEFIDVFDEDAVIDEPVIDDSVVVYVDLGEETVVADDEEHYQAVFADDPDA